jgi:hypothetical protein
LTESDWWDLIDQKPTDTELRLGFACWLQDEKNDAVAAQAVRWMVRTRRRVFAQDYPPNKWSWCGPGAEGFSRESFRSYRSYLPPLLFVQLTGRRWVSSGVDYETRRAGEQDLIEAYRKALGADWQPEELDQESP